MLQPLKGQVHVLVPASHLLGLPGPSSCSEHRGTGGCPWNLVWTPVTALLLSGAVRGSPELLPRL